VPSTEEGSSDREGGSAELIFRKFAEKGKERKEGASVGARQDLQTTKIPGQNARRCS